MFITILVVHVIVSVLLVMVVLLQSGRGAELGAAFGSVGQATFGRGRPTFLSKFTTTLAVIFMTSSLTLAFMSNEQPRQSVVAPSGSEEATPSALQPVPQPPGEGGQAESQRVPTAPQTSTEAGNAAQAPLQPTDAPPQDERK